MLRRLASVVLLALVVGSVLWAYVRPPVDGAPPPGAARGSTANVSVLYIHGDRRCATCEAIETGARRAVTKEFPEELAAGVLVFETRNTDRPADAHLVEELGLVSSSLVIATPDRSRFRVLQRVWELVGSDAQFDAYVTSEVRRALGGTW